MRQTETKSTPQIIAYLRTSTREQDLNSQKLELHEYARMPDDKRVAILVAFVKAFETIALLMRPICPLFLKDAGIKTVSALRCN